MEREQSPYPEVPEALDAQKQRQLPRWRFVTVVLFGGFLLCVIALVTVNIMYKYGFRWPQGDIAEAKLLIPQIDHRLKEFFEEFRKFTTTNRNPPDATFFSSMGYRKPGRWSPQNFAWNSIGFAPPNDHVRLQYWVHAGKGRVPATASCGGVIDLKRHFPTGKAADWYVICARNATGDPSRAKAQKSFQWFGMSNSPQFRGILFQRASPSWGTLLLRPMTLNLILSLVAALCLCLFFFFWFRRREA